MSVVVAGVQVPRLLSVPDYRSSSGDEAIELAELAGLHLDPWQQLVLQHALGERADGTWAALEVALVVARQNGKGSVLEARELASLFLLDEQLFIHSAHLFDTSLEHFQRILMLIEGTPELDRQVAKVKRSHGEEAIVTRDGHRLRFRTRSAGGGRGFSCDGLALDEAMFLPEFAHGALFPTLSARPNPQIWYCGSPVDQTVHEHGLVLARLRERALAGDDPRLAYFEWSVGGGLGELTEATLSDAAAWAAANPGLGLRISTEHVAAEMRAMDRRTFATERLGVGDWPALGDDVVRPIPLERWDRLVDASSELKDPVCFAFDVAPDRSVSSIAAAGRRPDGLAHVEIVEHRPGAGWVPGRIRELWDRHSPVAVMADGVGPAGSLIHQLELDGVAVEVVSSGDHAKACGLLADLVDGGGLRHLGSDELRAALRGATRRPLGDAWAWSRKNSTVEISPLVAATLALWGSSTLGWDPDEETVIW